MLHTMKEENGHLVISLAGEFTFSDTQAFQPVLRSLNEPDITGCDIDVGKVSFMDSTAISLLLTAYDILKKKGAGVIVRNAQGAVRATLDRVGFGTLVTME